MFLRNKENAIYIIMADLINKGYIPFYTLYCNLNFNLIACNNQQLYKLQTLVSNDGKIQNKNIFSDDTSFDFFATLLPSVDKVIYVPRNLNNQYIYISEPSIEEYYWYEDFIDLKDETPEKRKGENDGNVEKRQIARLKNRKVERPNQAILRNQINTLGYTGTGRIYGVSDNAIRKWENSSNE